MSGYLKYSLYVKTFQQLSTGQKYRAMLANLLSTESNIWLIDDFCDSLDLITTNLIAEKLSVLARNVRRLSLSVLQIFPF